MPQKYLSVKNYEKYQTTSKQGRPWIKLYKTILGDPEFMKLSTHHRFLYTGLLLLADDCQNKIYNDRTYLGQRLYISPTEIDLKPLYRAGFLVASNLSRVLSEKEKRREDTEREEDGAHAPPSPPSIAPAKNRPTPLPPEFKFSTPLKEWALAKGCTEPYAEYERFCSKAKSKGWTYLDWEQAFHNWVLNELKWKREKTHA